MKKIDWQQLEALVRRDPGGRGLASFRDSNGEPLLVGSLKKAADDLAQHGRRIAIVTGFAIITDDGVVAETDGPPGSIYLAAMLRAVGQPVTLVTDRVGESVIRAGLSAAPMDDVPLLIAPSAMSNDEGREGVRAWWREQSPTIEAWSHLIAVERVGPSYSGVCHNMRGVSLDEHTAPLDVLFEEPEVRSTPYQVLGTSESQTRFPATIGIVDGGNEIGCGNIPRDVLQAAVARGNGGLIACRTKTTHTIVAGVSNWGAYALGAAIAAMCGHRDAVESWTRERQQSLIEAMVEQGGAVDGVTKRREPTVDGLSLDEYLSVFDEIRSTVLG